MDELIRKVSSKIGIEEAVARQAVGAILAFLKDHSGRFDFSKIEEKISGTDALIQEAEEEKERNASAREGEEGEGEEGEEGGTVTTMTGGGGVVSGVFGLVMTLMRIFGILAMLKGILTSVFGESFVKKIEGVVESVEDGAELTTVLRSLNVNRDQGIKMVRMLIDFLKEKLDSDTIDSMVEKIPAIKVLMGESKKDE